ncbi:uncharacterized protein [Venturia canescens]|uniref:uncharacterized protein n=1 Tax=Venturia canescens TaxID=32260 RepID=UPI001C9C7092|nr:uncharacterized protein LOC122409097 [Venturia canescens]
MVEFVKNTTTGDSTRQPPAGTVATAARFVWSELQRLRNESSLSQIYQQRIASLDEFRLALGSQLATMTEAKIALENTIVAIRQETKDFNDVESNQMSRQCPRSLSREVGEIVEAAVMIVIA